MMLKGAGRKILSDVVSLPTAPFHEHKVISYVAKFCIKNGFRIRQDRGGNIYIRYRKGRAAQPVVFTAHMDHPGFEVMAVRGGDIFVGILGGVRPEYFKGADVVISTRDGTVRGRVVKKLSKKWMGKPLFTVRLKRGAKRQPKRGDFGYYDLPGFKLKDEEIFTKSADNLAGTALLLDLLKNLKRKKLSADVTVVLTRAEEVGFVGCIDLIERGSISKKVPVIVVETSDAVAGRVRINGGPVIRVGDKLAGFVPIVDRWMRAAASGIRKRDKKFRYQRALLAGGRCEASALLLKGYTVGGLAFPLGNYHNNGKNGYAPEYIGKKDYEDMLKLLLNLARAPALKDAFAGQERELWKNYKKWRRML